MEYAHQWLTVENWVQPKDTIKIKISEISWLLPNPENSSSNYLVDSYFINKPTSYDIVLKQLK